jgi:uncharacterized membrane protein (UPF0127 family)
MSKNSQFGWPRLVVISALAAFLLWTKPARAQQAELPEITLNAGIYLIHAEVAATQSTRAQGLMLRKTMAQGAGMLFVFDASAIHCMWMKNTLIPLSVAFMDERGRIVNIADMKPLDETSHCAARPARFALEMNQGWFKKRGIADGTPIGGLGLFFDAAR